MRKKAHVVLGAAVLLVFLNLLYPIKGGLDLWGHLYFGLDTIERGALESTNTYSYTAPEFHWTNHEWLFEALLALSYRWLGVTGLVVHMSLWLALLFGLLGVCVAIQQQRGGRLNAWTLLIAIIVMVPILGPGIAMRPQLATFVFTVALLAILQSAIHRDQPTRWLWMVPILFIGWVNLHGGFLVGLALLGAFLFYLICRPWLEPEVDRIRSRLLRSAGVVTALSILATLVNPYGYHHWIWLFRSLRLPRSEINEWRNAFAFLHEPIIVAYLISFLAFLMLLAGYRKRYFNFTWFAFICLGLMSLLHIRHFTLALCAGLPVVLHPLNDFLARFRPDENAPSAIRRTRVLALSLIKGMVGLIALALILRLTSTWLSDGLNRIPVSIGAVPVNAVRFMKINRIEGNVATHYNWGEYLIWHLYPRVRVDIDGRFRTAYPLDVLADGFDFYHSGRASYRILQDYPTTLILLPDRFETGESGRVEISGQKWVRIYRDGIAILLAKDSEENAGLLADYFGGELTTLAPIQKVFFP